MTSGHINCVESGGGGEHESLHVRWCPSQLYTVLCGFIVYATALYTTEASAIR